MEEETEPHNLSKVKINILHPTTTPPNPSLFHTQSYYISIHTLVHTSIIYYELF